MNTIPITIVYKGILLKGFANPIKKIQDAISCSMTIYIQGWCIGTLTYHDHSWSMDQPIDPEFVKDLGHYIRSHVRSIKEAMHNN